MIKLLWNSHNQTIPKKNNFDKEISLNHIWGIYHKENSDKWIFEILKGVKYSIIENETEIVDGDVLIIVDSSIEKKIEFYNKLKLICSKIFLIHLGDETGVHNIQLVYDNCDYIFRTFCSNKYFKNNKISCFPIGYKTGVIFNKKIDSRKYKWAFVGTPHKSSRHDLLYQLSDIKPCFLHKTKKFNEEIIDVKKMSEILSATDFIPCPNGFVHPETYRVYEALECECIPIVEKAYMYYERMFPNNPFLKVDKWVEAKSLIENMEDEKVKKKRNECKIWWINYKEKLSKFVRGKFTE